MSETVKESVEAVVMAFLVITRFIAINLIYNIFKLDKHFCIHSVEFTKIGALTMMQVNE